jgi:hypothetical protein
VTLSAATARINYPGAASTGPFSVPFRFFANSDLRVVKRSAAGEDTVLTYSTDYTATGAGNATGTVTLVTALAVGETIAILRVRTTPQAVSFKNGGQYFGSSHEDALDQLAMVDSQQQDHLDRAFRVMESYDPANLTLDLKPETGKVVGWASATQLTNLTLDSSAVALPGAGRTVSTLSAYLANNVVYNIKDYGALVDGATDDHVAVQLATDNIPARGGVVWHPGGDSMIGALVTGPNDRTVAYAGALADNTGRGACYKRVATYTTGPLFKQLGGASPTYGLKLLNLSFDGNAVAGDLVELNRTNQAVVESCWFRNSLGNGLKAVMMWNGKIRSCNWIACGKSDGTTWGLLVDSSTDGNTVTVEISDPYFEQMNGGSVWFGNSAGFAGGGCQQITWLGGKIEQSTNSLSLPFMRVSEATDLQVLGLTCVNGLTSNCTHIEVLSPSKRLKFDTDHLTSSIVDGNNPKYFIDIQGATDGVTIRGSYYRGGGGGGSQVRIGASVTNWHLSPDNIYSSSLSGVEVLQGAVACHIASRGPAQYYTIMTAFSVGTTVLGPLQGAAIVYAANGNTGILMAAALDGHSLIVVNEGATAITFNATDDTARVKNAAGSTIAAGTAARFVWDSRLGAAGLWVRLV